MCVCEWPCGVQGLLVDSVYDVQGQLHVKADDKKTWRRLDCVLQKSGLCCMTTSTGGGGGKQQAQQQRHAAEMKCLQSLSDVDIYLSLDWRKKHKSPSEHGIALKVRIRIGDCIGIRQLVSGSIGPGVYEYWGADAWINFLTLTLTLIYTASNWTHWVAFRRPPCLSRAATSASSLVNPIFCRSMLNVSFQFVRGRPPSNVSAYSGNCDRQHCNSAREHVAWAQNNSDIYACQIERCGR